MTTDRNTKGLLLLIAGGIWLQAAVMFLGLTDTSERLATIQAQLVAIQQLLPAVR